MNSFLVQYTDKETLERVFDGPIFSTEEEALLEKEKLERKGQIDVVIESENDIQLDRE
ncbi:MULTISPECIES: hypothetical protein [Bacillaceae]|uniref:hypothetical protein n=1 Tax=Bacillaceae TaxID=186817 RepID=UPI0015E03D00|nr:MULTISPECIES: hypothetical protein [Bacillaceae]QNG60589.1 hypothetical protein H4O14_03440 [Bacillus sp. PAMC26568]